MGGIHLAFIRFAGACALAAVCSSVMWQAGAVRCVLSEGQREGGRMLLTWGILTQVV